MDKAIHTDKHGTETTKAKVDQLLLREKIKQLREKGYEQEMRAFVLDAKEKQLEYEYRYNHYHDPQNGRFASGAGGGVGLYYSMGKGKGEIIGASSDISTKQKNVPQVKKALNSELISRVNAQNSMFYDAGSAIQNKYNNEWDEIDSLSLTESEKNSARDMIYNYSVNELNARSGFFGIDTAGPARGAGSRSDRAYDKAQKISGEHTEYMKQLRRQSDLNKRKKQEQAETNAIKNATEKGLTVVEVGGTKYYRTNKRSMTWHKGEPPKSRTAKGQLSFF